MKDALGHGSGPHGGPYLKPNGRSIMPARPAGGPTPVKAAPANMAHVADLRARLSAPKGGLFHSFTQGLKDALS